VRIDNDEICHLWAIGYDDMGRAKQVQDEIINLGWDKQYFCSMTLQCRASARRIVHLGPRGVPGRLQRLGLQCRGPPCGPGARRTTARRDHRSHGGGAGSAAVSASVGIDDDFVTEVKGLMSQDVRHFCPGRRGDMDVILHRIRGLGGTVLKTNVDLERARLIQSTLAASSHKRTKIGKQVVDS